ncbi:MAG: ribose-phosphate diphosphokinase, partial [Akkermansiaceae bacterium]|nr:ribose-phosphate diphosphokinase [Akkermansiaceae bacterium]
ESAIKELITTDSVPMAHGDKVSVVSIAGLMGDAISRIHDGKSVTSLFDIDV